MVQERSRHTVYDEDGLTIEVIITLEKESPILDELHKRIGHKLWLDRLEEELEWMLNG